jgi:hypothetical protein
VRLLCNARLRCKPGRRCRKPAVAGKLRCRLHGGAPGNGRHLSENASHSTSFSKARAARGPLYPLDPAAGGRARARLAIRGPDGRYLPGTPRSPHKYIVDKAQRVAERIEMAKTKMPAPAAERSMTEKTKGDPKTVAVPAARLTLAEDFTQGGSMALARVKSCLATEIDFQQLVDPAWLNDGENRKNAALILKLAQTQLDVALQLIRDQLEVGAKWRSREADNAERDRVLSEMARDLREDIASRDRR